MNAAVLDREEDIALMLVDAGANFETSGAALSTAAANGMGRFVERILSNGWATILANSPSSETGVVRAADNGYFEVVEVYLRIARPERPQSSGEYGRAATAALLSGYDDVARMLVDSGADSEDMLHVAARFGSPGIVRQLIQRGARVDRILPPVEDGIRERTPLDFALQRYRDELALAQTHSKRENGLRDAEHVIFELMRGGAHTDDVDAASIARDGLKEIYALPDEQRLVVASRFGFFDVARDLLASTKTWRPDVLRQAAIEALENDNDDTARLLLNFGSPVDQGVLHTAAAASSPGMVRYILRLGAKVSERFRGTTALQWWLENSATEDPEYILHELIVAGADACPLVSERNRLPGLSAVILRDSAPDCWDRNVVEQP